MEATPKIDICQEGMTNAHFHPSWQPVAVTLTLTLPQSDFLSCLSLFQALLFYLPRKLWKSFEGGLMETFGKHISEKEEQRNYGHLDRP